MREQSTPNKDHVLRNCVLPGMPFCMPWIPTILEEELFRIHQVTADEISTLKS